MDGVTRTLGALDRATLAAAYAATRYRVFLQEAHLDIRIGEVNPDLDRFLAGKGAGAWAFVSAVNPRSRILAEAENLSLHAGLCREVHRAGLLAFAGEAHADAGDWPAEAGLLVLDVSEARAKEMGRDHRQNAVVWAKFGAPPRLLWCL